MEPTIGPYKIRDYPNNTSLPFKIKLGIHNETNEHVSIRIIKKSEYFDNPSLQFGIQRDIAIMRLADHPNILKLIDIFESDRRLYIVEEYQSCGELFDYLVKRQTLNIEDAFHFFRQLIFGVEYLHHSLNIAHCNLKLENILIDELNNIKICNFGSSSFIHKDETGKDKMITHSQIGSPHYKAPEVLQGSLYNAKSADIWSCGVILFTLLACFLPFDNPELSVVLDKIKNAKYSIPSNIPLEISEFISHMLTVDPKNRFTIDQIKNHPLFRIGLPDDYILPFPLPLSHIPPIDIKSFDVTILDTLKHIGVFGQLESNQSHSNSNEDDYQDLINQLNQPIDTITMAKIFVKMLSERFDITKIDWSQSIDDHFCIDKSSSNDDIITTKSSEKSKKLELKVGKGEILIGSQQWSRQNFQNKGNSSKSPGSRGYISSFECFSLASRPLWSNTIDTKPMVQSEVQIICDSLSSFNVIVIMQKFMAHFGLQWYYPDEMTIICRNLREETYIIVHCQQGTELIPTVLILQMTTGSEIYFKSICSAVEEAIQYEIENQTEVVEEFIIAEHKEEKGNYIELDL